MIFFDTFPAKDSLMIRAIEVLHSLVMVVTEQAINALFVIKVDIAQNGVSLNNLVEYVEIERQLINTFYLFDEFPANGTSNSEIMVKLCQTFSTERVPTMNKNSGYLLAHVKLITTKVTEIEASTLIVCIYRVLIVIG